MRKIYNALFIQTAWIWLITKRGKKMKNLINLWRNRKRFDLYIDQTLIKQTNRKPKRFKDEKKPQTRRIVNKKCKQS
jgi:hypothetical protein